MTTCLSARASAASTALQPAGGVPGAGDLKGGGRDAGPGDGNDAAVAPSVGPVHPADGIAGEHDEATGRGGPQPRLRQQHHVDAMSMKHVGELQQLGLQASYVERPDMQEAARYTLRPPPRHLCPRATRRCGLPLPRGRRGPARSPAAREGPGVTSGAVTSQVKSGRARPGTADAPWGAGW